MLCENCGINNATTHIRSVINGVVHEKNLCDKCAAEGGYNTFGHNNLAQMLSSMLGDALNMGAVNTVKRCPCCNASFSDIAKSGKVGCSNCYETFYDELLPYLKRVHGATKHNGRIPNRAPLAVTQKEETVDSLRVKLSRLVSEEKFEEAAIVRDKIKEMEGEM